MSKIEDSTIHQVVAYHHGKPGDPNKIVQCQPDQDDGQGEIELKPGQALVVVDMPPDHPRGLSEATYRHLKEEWLQAVKEEKTEMGYAHWVAYAYKDRQVRIVRTTTATADVLIRATSDELAIERVRNCPAIVNNAPFSPHTEVLYKVSITP